VGERKDVGRKLGDWIGAYLDYTVDQESPEKIHFWTALTVISASLGRSVWMDRGAYLLYPNIYVCIVADSGEVRKSVATSVGKNILLDALPNIEYIEDRMSPEGLVKHLNRVNVTVNGPSVNVSQSSTVFIYEDELASLFGYDKAMAARMATLLTSTYMSPENYMHTTSGGGHTKLHRPCFTILASTVPKGLSTLPDNSSEGLLGRLIIIAAGKRRKLMAWSKKGSQSLREDLKSDLASISSLTGEMTVPQDARDYFEKWYIGMSQIQVKEDWLSGFHARCHDTALKIAMLLSASRSDSQIVNVGHVEAAVKIIEDVIPTLKQVGIWLVPGEFNHQRAKVEEVIRAARSINRRDVMKHTRINARDMDVIETTLEQEGFMSVTIQGISKIYKVI
jgi:hypothetical protein